MKHYLYYVICLLWIKVQLLNENDGMQVFFYFFFYQVPLLHRALSIQKCEEENFGGCHIDATLP